MVDRKRQLIFKANLSILTLLFVMEVWKDEVERQTLPPKNKQTTNPLIYSSRQRTKMAKKQTKKQNKKGKKGGQCLKLDYHPPVDRSGTQGSGQQGWCEQGMVTMPTLSGNWIPARTYLNI